MVTTITCMKGQLSSLASGANRWVESLEVVALTISITSGIVQMWYRDEHRTAKKHRTNTEKRQ